MTICRLTTIRHVLYEEGVFQRFHPLRALLPVQ